MKTEKTVLLLAGIFLFAAAVPALAQEQKMEKAREMKQEMTQEQEEKAAAETAGDINAAAKSEGGEKVRTRLMKQFGVDEGRIRAMREEGEMSYGEISLALSLAKGMEGGINDDNIAEITALRKSQPKMGWGQIARELGQKLGPAISETRKMSAGMRKDMKRKRSKDAKKDRMMMKDKEMMHRREMKEHMNQMPMGGGGAGKGRGK